MGEFPAAAAANAMDDFDFEGFDPDNLYTDMDTIIRILAEDPKPSVTIKGIYQAKSAPGEEQVYPLSDASHNMALETSSCSAVMDVDMNDTNMPHTIVQENHSGALSMSSSVVPDILLPDTICTETSSRDASDSYCNPINTCLKLWRDCTSGVEIASRHTLYDDPFLLHEKDSMVHKSGGRVVLQFPFENSYLTCTLDGSLSTTTPKVPVIDFYAPLPGFLCSEQSQCGYMTFKRESSTDSSSASSSRNFTSNSIDRFAVNIAEQMVSDFKTFLPNKKQKILLKDKWKGQIPSSCYQQYENSFCNDAVRRSLSRSSSSVDDDADIPKLDDISVPVSLTLSHMKLMSQQYGLSDSYLHGSGGPRLKADDERLIFQIAIQDLSQTTSEATPPDGLLTVSLLRHQRIALSWMVQKETASLQCCGGILADDQGLGKTISMIALILKERAPSSRSGSVVQGPDKLETLTLDDDDGSVSDLKEIKQPQSSNPGMMCRPIKKESFCMTVTGRPAARTLVVCPTSVLRQWADELQNKVTSKANLSFLVYHGSNRTKDPIELTMYDVVLTTYAIVSKEVPKQPIVVKDDEDRGTVGVSCPSGLSARKQKKKISNLKNQDSPLLEVAGPLGRVGWFRVILDEAQSIKNHKTQVARACWGLRAKRRWCMSGTPIQNAVDDLYSYFRFLRYDPYAVRRSFCSKIKAPISRDPTTGYQKLQAVLKTIMLRRTKGTLIDGKPIIDLPPKTVTVMKVDFSEEERAFYSTLERESRKQFKEYAAAGTVKQNYVNILLMLLRLQQACDHPFLITSYDSNSTGMSLKDMAKKLPRDRQITLLSCLESCLAICTICNDPPEDAVVTICGHVFCNQCICEHLTGDDNICPSGHCKVRLTVASVFSRNTLKSCLAGLTDCDHSSVGCVSNTVSKSEIFKERLSSGSSKINAALEILQSLPITSCSSSKSDLENSCDRSTISDEDAVNTVGVSYSVDSDSKYRGQYKSSNARATEKAIVFSQWTRMLDLLEVPLKVSGIQFRRLDGTMSVNDRDEAVKDFNTLPEVTVMIMSLKAASLGLNMIAACHVLLLDLWRNPTTENQAIDRAHRIGQTRPVTVFRLTVRDTVEDRILALQIPCHVRGFLKDTEFSLGLHCEITPHSVDTNTTVVTSCSTRQTMMTVVGDIGPH